MQCFCSLALGAVAIKAQTNQLLVLLWQRFDHLCQTDPVCQFLLRRFHRDIQLPVSVLAALRGQAHGGLRGLYGKGKEKRTRLLFILGCLWAAAVAVSRIWMGAHFLTDVTMAWLIALGMCALCVHLFYFDKRFFAKLWRVLSTSANPFLPKKRSVESPDSEPEN